MPAHKYLYYFSIFIFKKNKRVPYFTRQAFRFVASSRLIPSSVPSNMGLAPWPNFVWHPRARILPQRNTHMLPQKPHFFLAAAAETVTTQTMTKPLQPACAATVSDAGTVEGLILAWMDTWSLLTVATGVR
jgi:hypothetical protein